MLPWLTFPDAVAGFGDRFPTAREREKDRKKKEKEMQEREGEENVQKPPERLSPMFEPRLHYR